MSIPLVTALGVLQLVPSIVGLASGAKDPGTRAVLVAGAIVSALLALEPYVGFIDRLVDGNVALILALLAAVLGVITAVRVPNRVIGTLTATAGCLLALRAWDVVG